MPEKSTPKKPVFLKEIQVKSRKKRVKSDAPAGVAIIDAKQIYDLFKDLQNEAKEKLITVSLDIKLRIICFEVIAIGNLYSVYARPIELVRTTIPWNPHGFIIIHNHPSGDPTPSNQDKAFTDKLREVVNTLGCALHDHIIIGDDGYCSFSEEGLIPPLTLQEK